MPKEKSKVQQHTQLNKSLIAKSQKIQVEKAVGLSVPVYALDGTKNGTLSLPDEIFGGKVNKPLLAQAIRIYINNLKAHFGHTKTRSEVSYSTKKLGPQKGSGHARHGSLGAPIYVGGGIALGPKFRKAAMDLPKKMKLAALKSALADKARESEVIGVTGLEKIAGKTREMQALMKKIEKKDVLMVTDGESENLKRAARNLTGLNILSAEQINAYEIVAHQTLMISQEAIKKLTERVQK